MDRREDSKLDSHDWRKKVDDTILNGNVMSYTYTVTTTTMLCVEQTFLLVTSYELNVLWSFTEYNTNVEW